MKDNALLLAGTGISLDCEFIEKEVEMGFFENYLEPNGDILQAGCQRISHCSCNCNRCTILA